MGHMFVGQQEAFLQSLKQLAALEFDKVVSGHFHTPFIRADGDTRLALHDLWYQRLKKHEAVAVQADVGGKN
jgi:hypothetical protein